MSAKRNVPGTFCEVPANEGFMETAGIEPAQCSRQDDRTIGVERRRLGADPQVEMDVIRFQGRDVVFIDVDGGERIYDRAELRKALEPFPDPPLRAVA